MKNDLIGFSVSVFLHGVLALSVIAAGPTLSRPPAAAVTVPLTMAMFQTPAPEPRRQVVKRKVEHARRALPPARVETPAAPAPAVVSEPPPEAVLREPAPESTAAPAPPPAANFAALEAPEPLAVSSYAQTLAALIARQRFYPRLARLRGWQGQVEVQLEIAPGGGLVDVQVSRSSGFEILDRQAVEMVRFARPLPQPPEELRRKKFTVRVPVEFRFQS